MVQLKPITESDAQALFELITSNVDRLLDYFPVTVQQVTSTDTALATIIEYQQQWKDNNWRTYLIWYNNAVAGMLFIKHINTKHSKCELAYFVDEQFQGKGVTTKAVKQSIDIAFNDLELHKVFCKVDIANTGSARVAEKAGMVREGVLKHEYRVDNGCFVDIAYYGIINE